MRRFGICVMLVCLGLAAAGCRSMYYSAMESVGVYKRDLLKKQVTAARDEQKEAGEQFETALDRLQAIYGFEGGNLEKEYRGLKREFDRCEDRAEDVNSRIAEVEQVAEDLFKEWEKELEQISSANLRAKSREQLNKTRQRYGELRVALTQAAQAMQPVLTQFRDQVLYLKHNLNAQAIASLRGEAVSIETDIAKLIDDMNTAIRRADEFIQAMPE